MGCPAWADFFLGSDPKHVQVPLVLRNDFWMTESADSEAQKAFSRRKSFALGQDVPVHATFTDPAEYACRLAGGDIALLFDEHLNQRVFCRFDDHSFVEVAVFSES